MPHNHHPKHHSNYPDINADIRARIDTVVDEHRTDQDFLLQRMLVMKA